MINKFISQFTEEKISYKKFRKQYIQLSKEQEVFISTAKGKPYTAGLLLGEDFRGRFIPSSTLMDWISKHSERKAVLNHKSEWFFMCGKMIMHQGIIRTNVHDGLVLCQNERGENLGFGKIFKEKGKIGKIMIRPVYDKGFFLRKEKNKK